MGRYVIVANQTLGGEQLTARMTELSQDGAELRLVVPVTETDGTHQWDYPPIDRYIPDPHALARTLAEARLDRELARWKGAGVAVDGQVVDANPVEHVRELVRTETFEGVIVSTLPRALSRWLLMDLPHRLARAVQVPVVHIEGPAGPSL